MRNRAVEKQNLTMQAPVRKKAVDAFDSMLHAGRPRKISSNRRWYQPPASDDSLHDLGHRRQALRMNVLSATLDQLTYHRSDAHPVTP